MKFAGAYGMPWVTPDQPLRRRRCLQRSDEE